MLRWRTWQQRRWPPPQRYASPSCANTRIGDVARVRHRTDARTRRCRHNSQPVLVAWLSQPHSKTCAEAEIVYFCFPKPDPIRQNSNSCLFSRLEILATHPHPVNTLFCRVIHFFFDPLFLCLYIYRASTIKMLISNICTCAVSLFGLVAWHAAPKILTNSVLFCVFYEFCHL